MAIFTVKLDSLLQQLPAWSDPLWDGAGCVANTAHSCDKYGWFHREIKLVVICCVMSLKVDLILEHSLLNDV